MIYIYISGLRPFVHFALEIARRNSQAEIHTNVFVHTATDIEIDKQAAADPIKQNTVRFAPVVVQCPGKFQGSRLPTESRM